MGKPITAVESQAIGTNEFLNAGVQISAGIKLNGTLASASNIEEATLNPWVFSQGLKFGLDAIGRRWLYDWFPFSRLIVPIAIHRFSIGLTSNKPFLS